MSIELKITGADTKEFFANAAHAFLLLAHGGNTVFAQPSAGAQGAASVSAETVAEAKADAANLDVSLAVAEENPKVTAEPRQRKKAEKKAPVIIDNEPPADLPVTTVDEDPLGLNEVRHPDTSQTYTLDDMRQRVKDIIEAERLRLEADVKANKTLTTPAAVKAAEGQVMPKCVAHVRKLFAPFGIKLAAELKPEQFAEFIAASEPYLAGTAK